MSPLLERIGGVALIVAASVGLVLNIFGLVLLPRVEQAALLRVRDTLSVLDGTLAATASGLDVADQSLDNASLTIGTVESTTRDVSRALEDTLPLLDSVEGIMGDELPSSLRATQASLDAAQEGAVAVEAVLLALNSSLSFLGGVPVYDPEVSLAATLQAVSVSLNPLPESLGEIESNLSVAGDNLTVVQEDVAELASNIEAIGTTLGDAKGVTAQYRTVVDDQRALLADLRANAGQWVTWTARVVGMILVWLAIAQVGLLSQGFEMVGRSRRR